MGRPRDHARDRGSRREPGEGELEEAPAVRLRERDQALDPLEVRLGEEAPAEARTRQPRPLGWWLSAPVLAGEEPARERKVRQEREAVRLHRGEAVALDPPHEEVVLVLAGDDGREPRAPRRPHRVDHLPRGEVRDPDVADAPGAHEVVEGPERLLDRSQRIGPVELVEVDPVGAEAAEAVLDRGHDPAPRRAPLLAVVHRHAKFGGEDDVLPAGAEGVAEDLLRAAAVSVDVRGVEERDPEIERLRDHGARAGAVDPAPEVVAAEAYRRDAEARAAEVPELHAAICTPERQRQSPPTSSSAGATTDPTRLTLVDGHLTIRLEAVRRRPVPRRRDTGSPCAGSPFRSPSMTSGHHLRPLSRKRRKLGGRPGWGVLSAWAEKRPFIAICRRAAAPAPAVTTH